MSNRTKQDPSQSPGPRRATICVETARPADVRAAREWLEKYRAKLTFVSKDEGCGCCVHMWRVEGPAGIIDSLPVEISAADAGQWNR